jgi:hypothetical protein
MANRTRPLTPLPRIVLCKMGIGDFSYLGSIIVSLGGRDASQYLSATMRPSGRGQELVLITYHDVHLGHLVSRIASPASARFFWSLSAFVCAMYGTLGAVRKEHFR